MILLFNTSGKHVFSCQHIPDSHKTSEYRAAKLPDTEIFDFNRIYTLVDDEIVVGELKPVNSTEIERITAELAATQYQRERKQAYPPIGDQLAALWKGGEDASAMLAKIQAVKAQYPKPTGGNA